MLTVGTDWMTDTVADWDALPPMPAQARVKFVLALIGGVSTDPDGNGGLSLQPPPEIVQLVALLSE